MPDNTTQFSQEKFLIEEFKALRQEIDKRLEEGIKLLQFSVVAIAAVYAWLSHAGDDRLHRIGWWGPVLIAVFGIFQACATGVRILQMGEYLQGVERRFGVEGWQTSLIEGKLKKWNFQPGVVGAAYLVSWFALICVTVTIALGH